VRKPPTPGSGVNPPFYTFKTICEKWGVAVQEKNEKK